MLAARLTALLAAVTPAGAGGTNTAPSLLALLGGLSPEDFSAAGEGGARRPAHAHATTASAQLRARLAPLSHELFQLVNEPSALDGSYPIPRAVREPDEAEPMSRTGRWDGAVSIWQGLHGSGAGSAGSGPWSADALDFMQSEGMTVSMQDCERVVPRARRISRELSRALGHYVRVNLYISPEPPSTVPGAGSSSAAVAGFSRHFDSDDVFILQLHGRKRWEVYGRAVDHPTKDWRPKELHAMWSGSRSGSTPQPRATAGAEALGERLLDVVLEPGDTLHIPRGFVHRAVAQPGSGRSEHATLAVLNLCWADVVGHALTALLENGDSGHALTALLENGNSFLQSNGDADGGFSSKWVRPSIAKQPCCGALLKLLVEDIRTTLDADKTGALRAAVPLSATLGTGFQLEEANANDVNTDGAAGIDMVAAHALLLADARASPALLDGDPAAVTEMVFSTEAYVEFTAQLLEATKFGATARKEKGKKAKKQRREDGVVAQLRGFLLGRLAPLDRPSVAESNLRAAHERVLAVEARLHEGGPQWLEDLRPVTFQRSSGFRKQE